MKPTDIGKAYDQITYLWESAEFDLNNGMAQHQRAINFVRNRGKALDVGCGSTGRFIEFLVREQFSPEGLDVSKKMIDLARKKHPEITFHHQDICDWELSAKYDFISAWDSIWHIALSQQQQVITKLVNALQIDGVLIMSFGGVDEASGHTDDSMGPQVYYSSLGINGFLKLFIGLGCVCRHLEYDNYPDTHMHVVVQKT